VDVDTDLCWIDNGYVGDFDNMAILADKDN
jgi:hypothetical protein